MNFHSYFFVSSLIGPGNLTRTVQPGNNAILNGVMDVGTDRSIVWKNVPVPTTINVNGEKTITIR